MNIKKLLLSALLLTTTGFAYAQQTTEDFIQIEPCVGDKAIIAGVGDLEIVEPKEDDPAYEDFDRDEIAKECVKINLENSSSWAALQFDLWLPKGVEVGTFTYWEEADEDEEDPEIIANGGKWVSDPHIWNTPRLTWKSGIYIPFTISAAQQDDAEDEEGNKYSVWRVVSYNGGNKSIRTADAANDGDPAIMVIRLIATDQATTGEFKAYVKDAILAKSSSDNTVSGANCVDQVSEFKIQINAKVGKGGYGTFSWPRAVDFTGVEGVENVFIATSKTTDWLQLKAISNKKVPAGTGVIIQGTKEATVNPQTIADFTGDQGILGETSAAPHEAGSNDFALATKNGKTALYPVSAGLVIPKYKAYMTSADGAKYFSFGDTATSIDALDMTEEEGDIYTLGGQKVQKTTMKGVYIKNGQKVVVK